MQLGRCDSLNEIGLLRIAFGANGEGVEHAGAEREANCFILALAHCPLAENLHADDALALGAHFLDDADDRGGIGIHVGSDGIEPDEVNLDPR